MDVVVPCEPGEVTEILDDMAYVPALGFDIFLLVVAQQNQMYFKPEEDKITPSLLDGRLRFPFDEEHLNHSGATGLTVLIFRSRL